MDKKLIKISYTVVKNISQQKKSHTIGETLIMPCATDIVREMCGKEKAKALAKIPISNDTVKRCISSMSEDITVQCTARFRDNDFPIQFDESTDESKVGEIDKGGLVVLQRAKDMFDTLDDAQVMVTLKC